MGKKISSNQALEQRSRTELKSAFEGWAVNDLENDFGLDFVVQLASPARREEEQHTELTPFSCYVQLKAAESFDGGESVSRSISTDLFDSYWGSPVPIAFVFYEDSTGDLYYQFLQDIVWTDLWESTPTWRTQETVTVRIDRDRQLTDRDDFGEAVEACQRRIETRRYRQQLVESALSERVGGRGALAGTEHVMAYFANIVDNGPLPYELKPIRQCLSELAPLDFHTTVTGCDPAAPLFTLYDCCRVAARICTDEVPEMAEFFSGYADRTRASLRHWLVGNVYLNCEIDETFVMLDVYELTQEPTEFGLWMATQQYEDGVFWDENPRSICNTPTYKLVEQVPYEEATAPHNACEEGDHEMIVTSPDGIDPFLSCERCGLSMDVLCETPCHVPELTCNRCGENTLGEVVDESGVYCNACAANRR
ncbi:DUF4365 domain-containing protein [Halobaculum sp. MBLA0143]|uniref:DUF4365 domain-containing protein n=1 Tax=Halobaculum sp. MBLA0143 TaxID=3079933 RepID=UPI003525E86F